MRWISILLAVLGIQSAMGDTAFVDFELKRIFPKQLAGMSCDKVEKI